MVDPVKTQTHRPHRRKVLAGMAATLGAIGVAGGGAVLSPFNRTGGYSAMSFEGGDKSVEQTATRHYVFASDPRAKLDGYAVLPG